MGGGPARRPSRTTGGQRRTCPGEGRARVLRSGIHWDLPYENNTIRVGEHLIQEIHGYNPAAVYVRRLSGKTEGLSISEIIISVVGDGYAQEELDAENAEAARNPLGPKAYWRGRMVGKYTHGADGHLMTNEDFEVDWAE